VIRKKHARRDRSSAAWVRRRLQAGSSHRVAAMLWSKLDRTFLRNPVKCKTRPEGCKGVSCRLGVKRRPHPLSTSLSRDENLVLLRVTVLYPQDTHTILADQSPSTLTAGSPHHAVFHRLTPSESKAL